MKAPLTQITRVVSLMRLLAFGTGTAVVSLLLCMWMRSRQKEMAVFLSMGEGKSVIFWQALLESAVVFLLALLGGLCPGHRRVRLDAGTSSCHCGYRGFSYRHLTGWRYCTASGNRGSCGRDRSPAVPDPGTPVKSKRYLIKNGGMIHESV